MEKLAKPATKLTTFAKLDINSSKKKRREKMVGWQKMSLHDIRLMFFLHLYF